MIELLSTEEEWPDIADVQYQRAYVSASAHIDGGSAHCLLDAELGVAYPVISRSVPLEGLTATDHISPYGYGGPVSIAGTQLAAQATALNEFESRVALWSAEHDVVSDFRRLHPGSLPSGLADDELIHERDLLAVDLSEGAEAAFDKSEGRHRTAVRKAHRSGVVVRTAPIDSLSDSDSPFRTIYAGAMRRLDSADRYRVGNEYFGDLIMLDSEDILVLEAVVDGGVVASAIFLTHAAADDAFYHLSASTPSGNKVGATNLLLDAGLRHSSERGARRLILGGGVSPGDGLERFKASIGPVRVPFHIRRTIYRQDLYDRATSEAGWEPHHPATDFFPQYRTHPPHEAETT